MMTMMIIKLKTKQVEALSAPPASVRLRLCDEISLQ